ncbi:MAG: endonuclease [Coriobacteriaceae bacterium]|nr:endonuclease [Coriobacteriaceae bacterium]
MKTAVKRIGKVVLVLLAAVVLLVGGYVGYLQGQYNRIADHETLAVTSRIEGQALQPGKEYSAATYNVGFGAYTPDYTFFMDEGMMNDGTPTKGEHGIAVSRESVEACTMGAVKVLADLNADFMLLQEVDEDSTRSWNVNQELAFVNAFPDTAFTYAVNFHTGFLAYPWPEMHGIVNSGLLTLSRFDIESAERRSYPIDESFITKFFDLDRCFAVHRLPVANGKELVLINSHMSAYDAGGRMRAQQLAMISGVLAEERAKGNYVIAGGDWNHALCDSAKLYPSEQQLPGWVSIIGPDDVPEGFHVVRPDNLSSVATCRGADIPYEPGVDYVTTIDGFIVSDNVSARAQNVDTGYAYSDHNPVKLTFSLKK